MIYIMFLILCFLIIACGHREPKKKTVWDEIEEINAREARKSGRSYEEILREYGKRK